MTHSGGKPHKAGDRGQRYEISFFCKTDNTRKVLGWVSTPGGANATCNAVNLNPSMDFPRTRDRIDEKNI